MNKLIPGFGGLSLQYPAALQQGRRDPRGPVTAVVSLTPAGNAELARRVVTERLSAEGYSVTQVSIVPADFTFSQLAEWRVSLGKALRGKLDGGFNIDADEANNRVTIGVASEGAATTLRGLLPTLPVPPNAVLIRVTGRVIKHQLPDNSDLRAAFRWTIPGGVIIGHAGCTLGLSVLYDGGRRFLTASHCTPTEFGADPGAYMTQPLSGLVIGNEYLDPPPRGSASCYLGRPCRYSDVAYYTWSDPGLAESARIAATTNYFGSRTIDPVRPRLFLIDVRRGVYVGNVVDKIGHAGGWTYGNVVQTCVDFPHYSLTADADLLCVDTANYAATGGDSGAPVLIWYLDDRAEIAGIHAARFDQPPYHAIFSPIEGIDSDFGILGSL